ncbi:MAG: hypothetical protein IJW16_02980 [Clostridia bacterium]|nr:hypothetical protein [Clostridia bacterium]
MRSFFLTLVLFVLMIAAILCNALYIKRIATELTARLDTLPDARDAGCAEAARELSAFWEDAAPLVGLSVSYPIVDYMSEQAALLVTSAECGDLYGFRAARALLYDTVKDMKRLE